MKWFEKVRNDFNFHRTSFIGAICFVLCSLATAREVSNDLIQVSTNIFIQEVPIIPDAKTTQGLWDNISWAPHGDAHDVSIHLNALEKGVIQNFGTSLKVYINLDDATDFRSLAHQLAFNKKQHQKVEIKMRAYLKKHGSGIVPLENFLTDFVQENIHTFSVVYGPNCMGAAFCATSRYKENSVHVASKINEILAESYDLMAGSHEPKAGDVLIYLDMDKGGIPYHAATYLTEGLVFTKNGATSLAPYIFQTQKMMEALLYKSHANLSLKIYRFKAHEKAINYYSKNKALETYGREGYRMLADLLQLPQGATGQDKINALARLETRMISPDELLFLVRLQKDQQFSDVRKELALAINRAQGGRCSILFH